MTDATRAPDALTLLPLGGVGVIGMNNMLLRCGEDAVLLDCGVMFPGPREPGVDVVLPPMDVLDAHADGLRAIVLTHGHEDHIGAVPHVLTRHNVPVYGTRFTLDLVRQKLQERGLSTRDLHEISPGKRVRIGPFDFGFLRVTHSIPDCVSLHIRTPIGAMLFTGDFKIDDDLPDGTRFDREAFKQIGDEGVLLMMSDSTNAEVSGWTRSEGEVAAALQRVVAKAAGRVLVGMFSSNQYRLRAVVEAARAAGRYTALVGRSLERYHATASRSTRLDIRPSDLIDVRDAPLYDDDELVLVCTGSQGEMRATLRRIASGRHSHVRIHEGDTLLLSSRRIPGNERMIYDMVDDFTRAGARCVHPGIEPEIHASGHARADELRAVLQWVRPKFFVPVHGTHAFLKRHAEIGRDVGVEEALVIENGTMLRVTADDLDVVGTLNCAPWYADGTRQGDANALDLSGRRDLMHNGVVAVSVHTTTTKPRVGVITAGLGATDEDRQELAETLLEHLRGRRNPEIQTLHEELRRQARRFMRHHLGKRPMALVMIDGKPPA